MHKGGPVEPPKTGTESGATVVSNEYRDMHFGFDLLNACTIEAQSVRVRDLDFVMTRK